MSTPRPALFDAGRLDRRITLQTKSEIIDEFGQVIETWTDLAETWAKVEPMAGLERVQAAQLMSIMDTRFIIRWRGDIEPGMHRVVFDGRTYDIEAAVEQGRREYLQLDGLWTESPAAAVAGRVRAGGL